MTAAPPLVAPRLAGQVCRLRVKQLGAEEPAIAEAMKIPPQDPWAPLFLMLGAAGHKPAGLPCLHMLQLSFTVR